MLDPRHLESEVTITTYHQRVVAILLQDQAKISVALPAQPKIDQLRKEFEEMKNGMREEGPRPSYQSEYTAAVALSFTDFLIGNRAEDRARGSPSLRRL